MLAEVGRVLLDGVIGDVPAVWRPLAAMLPSLLESADGRLAQMAPEERARIAQLLRTVADEIEGVRGGAQVAQEPGALGEVPALRGGAEAQ